MGLGLKKKELVSEVDGAQGGLQGALLLIKDQLHREGIVPAWIGWIVSGMRRPLVWGSWG